MPEANRKAWSWSTGERGVNRVRAYEDATRNVIFLEFYERSVLGGGAKRERISLGHADRELAKLAAEELAAKIRANEPVFADALTLQSLFDMYLREVTPGKADATQAHDRRTAALMATYFGREFEVERLSRVEWERFIRDRSSGKLQHPPRRTANGKKATKPTRRGVGEAEIAYELNFLRGACTWATMAKDARGRPLLERNPLRGLPLPKNLSPMRSRISPTQYEALLAAARHDENPDVELALVLAHETGHRIGAIRQLRWSDVDTARGTITWGKRSDKIKFEHTTVMSEAAKAALQVARKRCGAIGGAWVFPSSKDAKHPVSRDRVRAWWQRLAARAELPTGQRLGWHSLRRKFATELKHTPLKDLAHLGGWKNAQTILMCYQEPDDETQRRALAGRVEVPTNHRTEHHA